MGLWDWYRIWKLRIISWREAKLRQKIAKNKVEDEAWRERNKVWIEDIKRIKGTDREARKNDYNKYINSESWKRLKSSALERANGKCQFCGKPASEIHHKKYPKVFSDDKLDNLVACCKKCHSLQH